MLHLQQAGRQTQHQTEHTSSKSGFGQICAALQCTLLGQLRLGVDWHLTLVGGGALPLSDSFPKPKFSARLAQSVERKALNLVVVGSSPTVGVAMERCSWQHREQTCHFV